MGPHLNNIFALVLIASIVFLNVLATVAVRRDEFSEPLQKVVQVSLIWIIPLLGALLVLGVHRKKEEPSRSYRLDHAGAPDYSASHGIKSIAEVLDDD